ncbi:MAG TPA: VWA domain-containing protein, partial [Polyangia bacterium]|nr:VWA domain-containing protein [Polyangia bacterium]
ILLAVDVSASGDFGSTARTKREIEAEIASVLALSAVRNSDRVGLVLFSDQIESFVPPRKGRQHVLRLVREVLSCRPERRGTDVARALEFVDRISRRRAMVFVLSDFQSAGEPTAAKAALRRALRMARRRHDVVALRVSDPRERELPDVGLLTVEDAETGQMIEIDTGSARVRQRFAAEAREHEARLARTLRQESIDSVAIDTSQPYLPALVQLFAGRARRRR